MPQDLGPFASIKADPKGDLGPFGAIAHPSADLGPFTQSPPETLTRQDYEKMGLEVSPVDYTATASRLGVDPRHLMAIVAGESGGDTHARTGSYYGLAQLSKSEVEGLGVKWDDYKNMGPNDQLSVAERRWKSLGYKPEMGLRGLALAQAAPAYMHRTDDPVIYKRGSAAWNSNPGWRGADGEIRPSSITAYYERRMPGHHAAKPVAQPSQNANPFAHLGHIPEPENVDVQSYARLGLTPEQVKNYVPAFTDSALQTALRGAYSHVLGVHGSSIPLGDAVADYAKRHQISTTEAAGRFAAPGDVGGTSYTSRLAEQAIGSQIESKARHTLADSTLHGPQMYLGGLSKIVGVAMNTATAGNAVPIFKGIADAQGYRTANEPVEETFRNLGHLISPPEDPAGLAMWTFGAGPVGKVAGLGANYLMGPAADAITNWVMARKLAGAVVDASGATGAEAGALRQAVIQAARRTPFTQRGAALNVGGAPTIFDPQTWENVRMGRDWINDMLGGGLKTLERADGPSNDAANILAGAKQAAARTMANAQNSVELAMGKGAFEKEFLPALMQDRLYGLRADAQRLIDQISKTRNFAKGYKNSEIEAAVNSLGGRDVVQGLLDGGMNKEAKQAAIDTLTGALDPGNDLISPDLYRQITTKPTFAKALQNFKDTAGADMAWWHDLHGGFTTERLGPLDTYVPLVRESGKGQGGASRIPFLSPKNKGNIRATGTGVYSADPEAMRGLLERRYVAAGKANLIDTLQKSGLIRAAEDADFPSPRPMNLNGLLHDTTVKQSSPLMMVKGKNGMTMVAPKGVVVPHWLDRELSPILDRNAYSPNRITDLFNALAVTGYAEPIGHGANLMAHFWSNVAGDQPIGAVRSFFQHTDNVEYMQKLSEMAKMGIPATTRPPHLGMPADGMKIPFTDITLPTKGWHNPFRKLVFGDAGLEEKVRVSAFDWARSQTSDPQRIRDLVNSTGTYVHGLDSAMERALKRHGLSPFATASKTVVINGPKAVLGLGPSPVSGVKSLPYWAKRQVLAGGTGFVLGWMGLHKAMTGKTPMEMGTPFGMLPLGTRDEHGTFHPSGTSLNLASINPVLGSGFKILGSGAYDTWRAGGDRRQVIESWVKDLINQGARPVTGSPTLRFGTRALLGSEPTVTSLTNAKGQPSVEFLHTSPGNTADGADIAYAALHTNPLTALGSKYMGFEAPWMKAQKEDESPMDTLASTLMDSIRPGLMVPSKDLSGRGRYLNKQQRSQITGGRAMPRYRS